MKMMFEARRGNKFTRKGRERENKDEILGNTFLRDRQEEEEESTDKRANIDLNPNLERGCLRYFPYIV